MGFIEYVSYKVKYERYAVQSETEWRNRRNQKDVRIKYRIRVVGHGYFCCCRRRRRSSSGSRSIIVVIEEEARQNEVRARGQVVVGEYGEERTTSERGKTLN